MEKVTWFEPFSEFSFGMNPRAKKGLGLLEDQCWRGCDVCIWEQHCTGWNGQCPHECQGLMTKPTVEIDGKPLMIEGKYTRGQYDEGPSMAQR